MSESSPDQAPVTGSSPDQAPVTGSSPDRERRPPAIDTRPYQRIVALIGAAVIVAAGVYLLAVHHGTATTGVPAGQRLHWFAAPLATSDLRGAANLRPPCTLAEHDPRALNLCLDARRGPIVLSLFVLGAAACERQVDALQTLSRRFARTRVQFLAVALNAGRQATAELVRRRGWTIPVAYDVDGRVGDQYGVVACPMVQLARRGGIVSDRLIGRSWETAAALYPHVRALLSPSDR